MPVSPTARVAGRVVPGGGGVAAAGGRGGRRGLGRCGATVAAIIGGWGGQWKERIRAVEDQGNAVKGQWKGSARAMRGSARAVERLVERRWKGRVRAVEGQWKGQWKDGPFKERAVTGSGSRRPREGVKGRAVDDGEGQGGGQRKDK